MKKILIITVLLLLCSCVAEKPLTEKILLKIDMQDNVIQINDGNWIMHLDSKKNPINDFGIVRTEKGFVFKSKKPVSKLTLLNDTKKVTYTFIDSFNILAESDDKMRNLFYWYEVIRFEVELIN